MKTQLITAAFLSMLTLLVGPAFAQAIPPGYEWRTTGDTASSPSPYPSNANGLRTEIRVDGAIFLKLHFAYSDFEQGFDFLKVNDESGALVINLTGRQNNFDAPVIKGSAALIDLYSDYSTAGRGFQIDRIEACVRAGRPPAQPPGPGPGPGWIEEAVLVQSPSPYPNSLTLEPYPVQRRGAKAMKLHFDVIDMEKDFDFLHLLDARGNPIARFTGKQRDFWTDAIDGDTVVVALTTDFSEARRGFVVDRIAAYVPGGGAPPPPPTPAPAELAEVRYLLGGARGTAPSPFPTGVIELRPRGQTPDRFILVVQGIDSSGAIVPAERLDIQYEVFGEVGTLTTTRPGEFLFEASAVGGKSGELQLWIPEYGDLPDIQVDVFARGGRGRGTDYRRGDWGGAGGRWGHGRDRGGRDGGGRDGGGRDGGGRGGRDGGGRDDQSSLSGLVADVLSPAGAPVPSEGNVYTLIMGVEGADRAVVSLRGTDERGGPARIWRPVSFRVRGQGQPVSVVEGDRGSFTVVAGTTPREATVEFTTTARGDREITAQVRFRVIPPPRALASLVVTLEGGSEVSGRALELPAGSAPVVVAVAAFDQHGRPFQALDLRLRAEISGDPAVSIDEVAPLRYRLTPRAYAGRGAVIFRDRASSVQSAPIDVVVTQPRFHHVEIFVQQGDQWVSMPRGPLTLDPQGFGQDSLVFEVRAIDERGGVIPDDRYTPRVGLQGNRTISMDRVAPGRYRLRSTAPGAEDGVQLIVKEPNGRDVLLNNPVQVVMPAPRLSTIRIFDTSAQHRELTDVVIVPLTGEGVDLEVVGFDQFGHRWQGAPLEPGFNFRDGTQPVQFRRITETPSVWRMQPKGVESPPVRLEIGLRGSPATAAALRVAVVDTTFVAVGTKRAEGWVKWGLKRDYDFPLDPGLSRTRALKLSVSKRFHVDSISLQLAGGEFVQMPINETNLSDGEVVRFDLPDSRGGATSVRINGYSDPNCELTLSAKQPEEPRRGPR